MPIPEDPRASPPDPADGPMDGPGSDERVGGEPEGQEPTVLLDLEGTTDPILDDPHIGTCIRGKWEVLERIGAGSFGTVYKVRDIAGDWIEALKILSIDRLRGADAKTLRARFLREAQITKRLSQSSPHIVGLSTYEEDAEAGLIYYLMEYVQGRTLADVLRHEGPLTVQRTAILMGQVCDALMAAHEGPDGIVHRDLKLENLMLTHDRGGREVIKVLDFGIATLAQQDPDTRLTAAGSMGTPGYAAPEQLRAEPVDARTDLFALGVIMYSLLTGRNPWLGHAAHEGTNQAYELMAATDRAEVMPMAGSGVTIPGDMAAIVLRLLRRDPAERFQSARELSEALEPFSGTPGRGQRRRSDSAVRKPSGGSRSTGRRLAAVWFADLVGYSTLSSTDEGAALALLQTFHETASRVIEEGGGRVVQFIGDATFAEFGSTDHAVRTATVFMKQFALATRSSAEPPLLRIGVHVGDVLIREDGDLFGDGVNVAARIQGVAEPGQILVSQDVWRQLKQRRDFSFSSVGERTLKGIGAPVWLFSVGDEKSVGDGPAGPVINTNPSITTMDLPGSPLDRARRVGQVALAYVVAAVVVYLTSAFLVERLALGAWVLPSAVVLLAIGLAVLLTTAWVQSRPTWQRSVEDQSPWSLDVPDLIDSVSRHEIPQLTWARAILGGVAAFAVLFGAAGLFVVLSGEGRAPTVASTERAAPATVAVTAFSSNELADPWALGVPELLALSLDGVGSVQAVARGVRSDSSGTPEARAMAAGTAVGAHYAIAGSIVRQQSGITLEASLFDVATGRILGRSTRSQPSGDFAVAIDGLATDLLDSTVLPAAGGGAPHSVAATTTASREALRAFVVGEHHRRTSNWPEAIDALQDARDLDPTFALARFRLAMARVLASRAGPGSSDADALAAFESLDRLPVRMRPLAEALAAYASVEGDPLPALDRATRSYPDDPDGWFLLGDVLYHARGPSDGTFTPALERAIQLDPGLDHAYAHLIDGRLASHDTSGARSLVAELTRVAADSPFLPGLREAMARATSAGTPAAPQGVAAVPPDPRARARADYERRVADARGIRAQATSVGHPSLRDRVSTADSVWDAASALAARESFPAAVAAVAVARGQYEGIVSDARILEGIEADRAALDPLRAQARDPGLLEQAAGEERAADRAVAEGAYAEATAALGRAASLLQRAGIPPTSIGPVPPQPEPGPALRPEAVAEDVLARLKSAMEAESLDRVRAVWTSISAEEAQGLERLFRTVSGLRVTYDVISASARAGRVIVEVGITYDFQPGGPLTAPRQIYEMDDAAGSWLIVASRTAG